MDVTTNILSTPFAARTTDVQVQAAAPGLRFMGYHIREGNGAAATIILRHGTSDSDPIIAVVELATNASDHEWMWPGLPAAGGIFLEVVAGMVDIVVYHATPI